MTLWTINPSASDRRVVLQAELGDGTVVQVTDMSVDDPDRAVYVEGAAPRDELLQFAESLTLVSQAEWQAEASTAG